MRCLLLFPAFVYLAAAVPSPRLDHVIHEKRAAEPVEWVKVRRLEADKVLPMRFGLAQQNLHKLEELLMSVSHPESPNYGQYFSPEKVAETFAPSEESVNVVTGWLTGSGIAPDRLRLSLSKGWLEVNATTAEVENLLNTEYHVYGHPSGAEQISCSSYSVPAHVQDHVDLIKPTVHFNHRTTLPPLNKRSGGLGFPSNRAGPKINGEQVTTTLTLAECDQYITLDCLRSLYSINYKPVATANNSYGIVEFTPQAYVASDMDLFFRNFSADLVGVRPETLLIDGAVVQTTNRSFSLIAESDLDLQYSMGLTNPQPITLLQTGDIVEGAGFDNWLDAVDGSFCTFEGGDDSTQDGIYPDTGPGGYAGSESCGIIKPPNVVSISYNQDEYTATPAYAIRQCAEYGKLGLLGSTILYSSGDYGVAGYLGVCLNSTGSPVDNGTQFSPGFPGSCPYVTTVGATQINPGSTVNDPESACEQVIYSGGGFSNIFPLPSYQASAVTSFLTNHPPPYTSQQYNNSGTVRGFPDLSANGANYVIALNGSFNRIYGTSASSPVVGSLITLINDARIASGKGPVGFINPAIYSSAFASGFNDIISGGNQGCGTPGFNATTGWDPVTGLGTPNLDKLLPLFLALP